MNRTTSRRIALLCAALSGATAAGAPPIGTTFTYQGQLKQNNAAFTGTVNMTFSLWRDPVSILPADQLGVSDLEPGVAVEDGLFTVQLNDTEQFGPDAFTGEERWLEMTVEGTTLSPRQQITAAPYALGLRPGTKVHVDPGLFSIVAWPASRIGVEAHGNYGVWGQGECGVFGLGNRGVQAMGHVKAIWGQALGPSAFAGYFEGKSFFSDRVGIGIDPAPEMLSVNGVIQSLSGGFKFPDNTVQLSAGLSLPSNVILPYNGDILSIRNTDTVSGVAARFSFDNALGVSGYGVVGEARVQSGAGVRGTGWDGAVAVYGLEHGTNHAGVFSIENAANANAALRARTLGTGPAILGEGIIQSSVGGFKFPDGTIQTTAAVGGAGFWTASGSHIFNNNAGNVGIGEDSPTAKLEVSGYCLGLNCLDLLRLNALGDGYTNALVLRADSLNTDHTSGPGDIPPLRLNNESFAHVVLAEGGGSVGIGQSPTQKLDVAGIIRSSSGGIMFPDNTVQTTAATGGPGYWSSNGSHIHNNNSGSVGIGTSSPDPLASLHVRRNDDCANCDLSVMRLTSYSNIPPAWEASLVFDGTSIDSEGTGFGTPNLVLNSSSNGNVLLANGGGSVGIGTTSPDARLEVTGEAGFGSSPELLRLTTTLLNLPPVVLVMRSSTINAEYGQGPYPIRLNNASAGDVTLAEGGGNVGIGTSSPDRPLEVEAEQAVARLTSSLSSIGSVLELKSEIPPILASSLGAINFVNAADSVPGQIAYKLEDGDWQIGFRVGGEEQMEIRADGTTRVKVLEITGADVAEKFPTTESPNTIQPGTVMEIDPDNAGKLRIARGAYNRRVAGVVSGAGDLKAGTILGNMPGHEDAPPIALSGRVWVRCEAAAQAIETGDMLTTSESPGHAMKAVDYSRAQGAVIGKAMTSLGSGETGLVLVLVSLQ